MVHQQKVSFNWFLKICRVSDDLFVADSLFHDTGPATANAQSPKMVLHYCSLPNIATKELKNNC